MKTTIRKIKLTDETKASPYDQIQWAYVEKIKSVFRILHNPFGCKDYTHQVLCNSIHKSNTQGMSTIGAQGDEQVSTDKLRMALLYSQKTIDVCGGIETLKLKLEQIQAYINKLEKANGWAKTNFFIAKSDFSGLIIYVCGSNKYVKCSPALHWLMLLLRVVIRLDYTEDFDMAKASKELHIKKSSMNSSTYNSLMYMVNKCEVDHLIYKGFEKVYGKLTLEEIYDPSVGNFHSGFGIQALCNRSMSNAKIGKPFKEILLENKVPDGVGAFVAELT
jgi:hypothetical protein